MSFFKSRLMKLGGPIQPGWGKVFPLAAHCQYGLGYGLFKVAAPTRPPNEIYQKNPRTGRGLGGFPCDLARRERVEENRRGKYIT